MKTAGSTRQESRGGSRVNDVHNRLEHVKTRHSLLSRTRKAKTESELYYQQLLVRFRRGKATSVAMRNSLESMIQLRQRELESLVYYNVTLPQLDLPENEIFEQYNLDIKNIFRYRQIK